jgi:hypothetical protein
MTRDLFRVWIDDDDVLQASIEVPERFDGKFADREQMTKVHEVIAYGREFLDALLEGMGKVAS